MACVCVCMRVVRAMQCAMSVHGHVHWRGSGRGWGQVVGGSVPGVHSFPLEATALRGQAHHHRRGACSTSSGLLPPPAVGRESQTERGLCVVAKTGVTPRPLPLKGSGESLAHRGGSAHVGVMVSVSASPGWSRRPEVAPAPSVTPWTPREEPGLVPRGLRFPPSASTEVSAPRAGGG